MTPDQLSAIRERLDAATPGEWGRAHANRVKTDRGGWRLVAECDGGSIEQIVANTELIAHAPTDLRALLDEVERLTKREDELVKAGLDLMVALKAEEAR